MTSMVFATILQASIIATGANTYADARHETDRTGHPMVILVGAEWCPACVTMKNTVVPQAKRRGLLRNIAFAVVDLDRQRDLAQKLVKGGPIPQFIMFRKTREGWLRRKLVGGQSLETVETFLKEGIQLDEDTKIARANNDE